MNTNELKNEKVMQMGTSPRLFGRAWEKKSLSELIRLSVDALIHSNGIDNRGDLRQKALDATGRLKGPENLAAKHDDYLSEAYEQ
jgi:hypothetical protein